MRIIFDSAGSTCTIVRSGCRWPLLTRISISALALEIIAYEYEYEYIAMYEYKVSSSISRSTRRTRIFQSVFFLLFFFLNNNSSTWKYTHTHTLTPVQTGEKLFLEAMCGNLAQKNRQKVVVTFYSFSQNYLFFRGLKVSKRFLLIS